jgi:hypothetical protein
MAGNRRIIPRTIGQATYPREHFGEDVRMNRVQNGIQDLRRDMANCLLVRGSLVEAVALPGIRGRVASISGTTLTLFDPATAANFSADAKESGHTVVASADDGSIGTLRSGSVNIARTNVRTGEIESGSGNWTTAIPGLSVGDYLFGEHEWGPPVPAYAGGSGNKWTGLFSSGPVLTLRMAAARIRAPNGVIVVRSTIQRADVWWLGSTTPDVVNIGSRFAGVADLWFF